MTGMKEDSWQIRKGCEHTGEPGTQNELDELKEWLRKRKKKQDWTQGGQILSGNNS